MPQESPRYAIGVYWSDEDQCWIATVPDLGPCSAHADTPTDAIENVQDAIAGLVEQADEQGVTLPQAEWQPPHL